MIHAENHQHVDLLSPDSADRGGVEMGTVGWDDGTDDLDQGSTGNDGNTLIKVQLFRGKDPATPPKPGVAQGIKLLCQISSMFGIYWIPPAGTRVLVAIPAGMSQTQGAALIIAAYQTSPTAQFVPGRVMWDVGSSTHVLIKAESVTAQSYASPAQYIGVGQPMAGGAPGIYLVDETGSGITVQSGVIGTFASSGGDAKVLIQVTASGLDVMNKPGNSQFKMDSSGNFVFLGNQFQVPCGGGFFGVNAIAANFAGIFTVLSPTTAVPSAHWLIGA